MRLASIMMATLHPPEGVTPLTFLWSPRPGSLAWRQRGACCRRGRAGRKPGRVPSSRWGDPRPEGPSFSQRQQGLARVSLCLRSVSIITSLSLPARRTNSHFLSDYMGLSYGGLGAHLSRLKSKEAVPPSPSGLHLPQASLAARGPAWGALELAHSHSLFPAIEIPAHKSSLS